MKYILLVDDNKDITDTLMLVLSSCLKDVSFRTAANGREAVKILENHPVDLVLTDINMPVMDGYQLIEYRNKHHPGLPLIAMTADASQEVVRKLNSLGISDCLEKPFGYKKVTLMFLQKLAADRPEPSLNADLAACR